MKILKFGGSSVGNSERIKNVLNIVIESSKNNGRIGVVFSAFQGVTDSLIQMSNTASLGDKEYVKLFNNLQEKHFTIVSELISVKNQERILADLKKKFNDLSDMLHGVFLIKELSAKTLDYIMSFGERFSAYIISEALIERNVKAEYLDSRKLIAADECFGSGKVNFELTNERIKNYFAEHQDIQIITGFIASTSNNETITLGRGGSDFTASILGAALSCDEIEIWTDVNGVMTADPRKVKRAFSIECMSYEEAMEMSHFGAKVIHPPTMQPALNKKIPIRIKNTFQPSFPGTVIGKRNGYNAYPVKGISSIDDIALIQVQGGGMVGVAGVAKRIFTALANGSINIILISQASSEHSICIAVMPKHASKAKKLIEEEFKYEIKEKIVSEIKIETQLSVIAVVGENMRNTPGIAGKVFSSLGKNGINIIAIAQGSSELNISAVISRNDEAKALNAIHDAFFLSDYKSINLFVVGTGLIGRTLFRQIQNQVDFLSKELKIDLKIIAIANSRKMLFDIEGMHIAEWEKRLAESSEKMDLSKFVKRMTDLNLPNSIFVDCTSSEQLLTKYLEILQASISIVTPNKKANSSHYEFYLKLKQTAPKHNVKFLYETNVGAGLPVISTLHDLVTSGDKVLRIEGVLSGTLSYIFNTFDGTKPFSELVKNAREKGFTEPDPRDDLNGLDVARKLLILVREAGYRLELSDIKVQSLIPEGISMDTTVEQFFKDLKEHDASYEQLRAKAYKEKKVLRYIAKYEDGKAEVSLQAVDQFHPFYSLHSNDNIIAFKTVYYCERPMVVQGPGAGADVTSGGIFADIIRIGNYLL